MTIPNDPESEGIPDIADPDSVAWDDPHRQPARDSPPSLPADEPVAADDYGVTPAEEGRDEPLSARLVREEPDVSPDDPETAAYDELAAEVTAEEEVERAARDGDEFGYYEAEDVDLDAPLPGEVGRIVEFDEGAREDTEGESIAYDSGERKGLSAEEAAMHEVPENEIRYE